MADEQTTAPSREARKETSPKGSGPQWRVEGARKQPESEGEEPSRQARPPWAGVTFWIVLAGLLVLSFTIVSQFSGEEDRLNVPYTVFVTQVQDGNVTEITSEGETIQGDFAQSVEYDGDSNTKFETQRPEFAQDNLLQELTNQGAVVNANPIDDGRPLWQTLLFTFGPVLLLVGLFLFIFRRAAQGAAGGAGALAGLGRSRARRFDEGARRVSFDDVAGIQEAKDELVEIVDFLRDPEKYRRLGGEIPRGVLLYGPPGTGKTLLARAVAGEADVPFFSLSASEFVEMIVGVGASRVRDLFQQAKDAAPAIIFIDELDAIGRRRGGAATVGTNDEREQTLNQILTEMDGFTGTEGVIVLGATNRPEVLDAALLRPGRFDRRVAVQPPDQQGRAKILAVHTRNMPLGDDVDLDAIASSTPGMVGADLKNLTNEAALTAARRGHDAVENADFTDALEKVVLGTERNIMLSVAERERTAYHESGHALLGMLIPGADPVRKVSIVPRGQALGVTFQAPDADRYGYDAEYLRGRIIGALGGRAAEDIVYGNVTTGAESDLEQVTGIAQRMVGRWGMSEQIGPIAVLPPDADNGLVAPRVSPHTQELVDREIRRIVDGCYERAIELLTENRDKLEALTQRLLQEETLDELDAYEAAGIERPRSDPAPGGSRADGSGSPDGRPASPDAGEGAPPTPGGHSSPY